jgi:hypothetical protein
MLCVFKAFFKSTLIEKPKTFYIELNCPFHFIPFPPYSQTRNEFANILSSCFGFGVETVSFVPTQQLVPDCKVLMSATADTIKESLY